MFRYMGAHWRGELSIWTSLLLNGVAIYVLLVAFTISFGEVINPRVGFQVFLAWSVWAVVGMVRAAFRVLRTRNATLIQRAAAVEALLVAAVITWYGARSAALMLR